MAAKTQGEGELTTGPHQKVPLTRRLQDENKALKEQLEQLNQRFSAQLQSMQDQFNQAIRSRAAQMQESQTASMEMIADCLYVRMRPDVPDQEHIVDKYRRELREKAEAEAKALQEERKRLQDEAAAAAEEKGDPSGGEEE